MSLVHHLISWNKYKSVRAQSTGWRQLRPYERKDVSRNTQCLLSGRRSISVSIHSIPSEILGYIFVLGFCDALCESCRNTPRYEPLALDCTCSEPWEVLVSRVCDSWRAVAAKVPLLWSRPLITVDSKPEKLRWYTEHSGTCSLDVRIFLHVEEKSTCPGGLLDRLKDLYAACDRWREFHVVATDRAVLATVMHSLVSLRTPTLEVLHAEYFTATPDDPDAPGLSFPQTLSLRDAFRLRDVRLCGCDIPLITSEPTKDLESFLVVTHGVSYPAPAFHHIIAASASTITQLTLGHVHPPDSHFQSFPLHLPRLVVLRVKGILYMVTVLRKLSAPALHTLHLEHLHFIEDWITDRFLETMRMLAPGSSNRRCGKFPELDELVLSTDSSSELPELLDSRLLAFLRCFPSLQSLSYQGPDAYEFIQNFTAASISVRGRRSATGSFSALVLPRLGSFTVILSKHPGEELPVAGTTVRRVDWIAALAALTDARRAMGAPLKGLMWDTRWLEDYHCVRDFPWYVLSWWQLLKMRLGGVEVLATRDIALRMYEEF